MEKWTVYAKRADFKAIGEKFGIDPVIARVIRNRDIVGDEAIREYLYGGLERLKDPHVLKDMDRAVSILQKKIEEGAKIRIVGDYDIDGIMSSYILKRGLHELGADADVRIPDRVKDGYGINKRIIEEAHADGVDTILTCDNGIAALEPVKLAKSYGMTVVVTDHHEVLELPEADAVVDPKRPDDTSESGNLCGAAVVWKLILAMGGDAEMNMLQYAGFATVGDIMELTGENRVIVKEALKRLRHTDNIGLRALAEVCGMDLEKMTSYHIGFILGPCLNASGRLTSAMRGLELLESSTDMEARRLAQELKDLNDSRKSMTESGAAAAVRAIEEGGMSGDRVLVIYLPDVHESVAGIIAGRIREKYNRPTIVLTRAREGVKGSGRSIPAYPMFDELVRVKDILTKFGGHPMAAGLSLREEDVDELRRRLNGNCTLTEEDLAVHVRIDVPMPVSYVNEKLIADLELLEPFGKGNEKPVFADRAVLCEHPRVFGASHNLLKTRVRSLKNPNDADPERLGFQADAYGPSFDAISFRNVDELETRINENPSLQIIYEPEINSYMGTDRIQIVIERYR